MESTLEITAAKTINKFQYRCIVSYDNKEIGQKQDTIEVIFFPVGNRMLANPTNGVPERQAQSLICETGSGFPKPTIKWKKTPTGATSSQDITFMATDSSKNSEYQGYSVNSRIIVTDTYRKDNNCVYSCIISQEGSPSISTLKHTLRVYYPPDVLIRLNPTNPKEGDRVELECLPSGGNPDQTTGTFVYLWKLKRSDGTVIALSSKSSSYVITRVAYENIGEYQCIVENKGGASMGTASLNIIFAPTIDSSVEKDFSASLNNNAIIELPVQANPSPTAYQWYKISGSGKVALSSGDKYNITQSGNNFKLLILHVVNTDFGTYSCIVSNSVGSREFEVRLLAPGPPSTPSNFYVLNVTAVSAVFVWRSELSGGSKQTFQLQWRLESSSGWDHTNQVNGIPDPGYHKSVYYTVLNFLSATQYAARVKSINQNINGSNTSPYSSLVSFATKQRPTIPSSSLYVHITNGLASIQFTPPSVQYYTSIKLKTCQSISGTCNFHTLLTNEVITGRVSVVLPDPKLSYYFILIILDGDVVVFESQSFKSHNSTVATAGLSFEIVLGISIGSAVAVAVLLAAVIVTAILQCRRHSELDKSIRSTNSSDVTNTSNGHRSPAFHNGNGFGNMDSLQYGACRSSSVTSQDLTPLGQSHSVTDLSPTSRMSHEFPPVVPISGMMPSHLRAMATSNGSLGSPPDVLLSDSNTDLYRPHSRTSVASNRSRSSFNGVPTSNGYYVNGVYPAYQIPNGHLHHYHHLPIIPTTIPEDQRLVPGAASSGNTGILELRPKPPPNISDYNISTSASVTHSSLQPIFVATPLTPHMESNFETIENYV